MVRLRHSGRLLAALLVSWTVNATQPDTLATHPTWLHLLHFHHTGMVAANRSQVDDSAFFLDAEGSSDPLKELEATIRAFRENGAAPDQSPACVFPARHAWLQEKLGKDVIPDAACPELDAWLQTIDGQSLTLVFPAAYLNSPSSMFGHTLFRVGRSGNGNPLLDYAVNYAANADPDDNQLIFSIKGLTGGYPGVFTIVPYYDKIKEYSFLDSRDVWEYDLDLTPEEVRQFLRHVWELKDRHLDYYFFTENCSYQLLTLLDAASDRFDYTRHFRIRAIPADTVRVLVRDGLVTRTRYRPSNMTEFSAQLSQADPAIVQRVIDAVELEQWSPALLADLDERSQAQVLDLAYRYARYLSSKQKAAMPHLGRRTIVLLSERSRLPVKESFAPPEEPAYRDDQGHDTLRLEWGLGSEFDNDFVQLGIRAAYHDLLDPLPGYPAGAQLEMFQLRFRQSVNRSSTMRLHELRLIDIRSLTAVNPLVQPISWQVAFGLGREIGTAPLGAYLNGGGGRTVDWDGWMLSGQLLGSAFVTDEQQELGAGPQITIIRQADPWGVQLESRWLQGLVGYESGRSRTELAFAWQPSTSWQWRLSAGYLEWGDENGWLGGLTVHAYIP